MRWQQAGERHITINFCLPDSRARVHQPESFCPGYLFLYNQRLFVVLCYHQNKVLACLLVIHKSAEMFVSHAKDLSCLIAVKEIIII